MASYRIVRYHRNDYPEIIEEGLSLAEVQEHCNNPETRGEDYFDGYEVESED